MGLETFERVYHIGIAIEDDLLKEGNNKNSKWNNNTKKNDNAAGSSNIVGKHKKKWDFEKNKKIVASERIHNGGYLLPIGYSWGTLPL